MLETLLALVRAGIEVAPYVAKLAEAFAHPGEPTVAETDQLTAMELDLDAQLANAQPGAI